MRVVGAEPGAPVRTLLGRYGLTLELLALQTAIPGSYWGESEAGLVATTLYARPDTPLHSLLHEASHFICMDEARRGQLHTDAGGDDAEECAVCYLQILMAPEVGVSVEEICRDMDAWGYSFRLGSAQVWFERDAEDARTWLLGHGIIDTAGAPTWRRR